MKLSLKLYELLIAEPETRRQPAGLQLSKTLGTGSSFIENLVHLLITLGFFFLVSIKIDFFFQLKARLWIYEMKKL